MARTEFTPPAPPPENTGNNSPGAMATPAWMPKWYSEITVDTSSLQGIANASDTTSGLSPTWMTERPMSADDIVGEFGALPNATRDALDRLAKAIDYRGTGASLWAKAVATSQTLLARGVRMAPMAIIQGWVADGTGTPDPPSGGGGYGGGGAMAPQPADSTSIRRAMDQVSTGLLGRTLSDKEFNAYYKSYTSVFAGNPDMDPTQDMIEAARTEDDYQEYQVATKFAGALQSVLKGSI